MIVTIQTRLFASDYDEFGSKESLDHFKNFRSFLKEYSLIKFLDPTFSNALLIKKSCGINISYFYLSCVNSTRKDKSNSPIKYNILFSSESGDVDLFERYFTQFTYAFYETRSQYIPWYYKLSNNLDFSFGLLDVLSRDDSANSSLIEFSDSEVLNIFGDAYCDYKDKSRHTISLCKPYDLAWFSSMFTENSITYYSKEIVQNFSAYIYYLPKNSPPNGHFFKKTNSKRSSLNMASLRDLFLGPNIKNY